ncbi:hypothetical protein AaE_004708, partial [Aphanomyces astaci]
MVDSMDDGAWRSLQSCVDNAIAGTTKGASMVVSGLPGSGKSTLLRRLAAHVQSRDQQPDAAPRPIHVVQINAMELQSTSLVLRTLARQVAQQANFSTDLDAVAALDAAFGEQPVVTTPFNVGGVMYRCVFLDDVDVLLDGFDDTSLCRLLQWTCAPTSSLVLVATTTAPEMLRMYLDHAVRHGFLQSNDILKMEAVPPCTHDVLYKILSQRVEPSSSTAAVVLMDAMALMYVARK